MKKRSFFVYGLLCLFMASFLASCASNMSGTRKRCPGNGGWYGNRNLDGKSSRYR